MLVLLVVDVVLSSVSPSHSLPLQFDVGIGPGCIFPIKATNMKQSTRPTFILMDGFCFSVSRHYIGIFSVCCGLTSYQ